MHAVSLEAGSRIESVLAIGCHADDIEIGCGGTIAALVEQNPDLEVTWFVLSAEGARASEAAASAEAFLAGARRPPRIILESFRDSFFPYVGGAVKEAFERLKPEVSPQLVLTHAGTDLHQDHRHVAELTWNTFRDHLILEFEIPKYDADLGSPNVFVPLSEEIVRRKVATLLEQFGSQRSKHWFTEDLFVGLMRLRGMESNSPTGYAEAFRCRKLQLVP
jgi:LmbE family N-acetylglucosaminyl deacetylase